MVGDGGALVRLLAHDVEIVVLGNQALGDQSSCVDVADVAAVFNKKALVSFDVDHDDNQLYSLSFVNFLEFVEGGPHEELLVEFYLIASASICEDDDFFWTSFVSVEVGSSCFEQQVRHSSVFVSIGWVSLCCRENRTEGGVDCCADCQQGLVVDFSCVVSHKHGVFDFAERLRHPKSISSFGQNLQQNLGGNRLETVLFE